jgi:signal transduction histidine kinase
VILDFPSASSAGPTERQRGAPQNRSMASTRRVLRSHETKRTVLNMPKGSEQQRTRKMLVASPIQGDLHENRESWQTRISSIGWLSTSIVHDLRNPVGTVFAGAEMLIQLDPTSTQAKRLAANIYCAAGRLRELLADLAGASCGNKSISEVCNLSEIIIAASETALPAADTQCVQILHDVPDEFEISLERSRMERVFVNLITNALEAMPHGGKIRIGARKADNCMLIEVEDTGPGIPRGIRDRLFEPFVTAGKDHGLGLGLALSRQTLLDHGGDMWTEPARGARFVMSLPLSRVMTAAFNGMPLADRERKRTST